MLISVCTRIVPDASHDRDRDLIHFELFSIPNKKFVLTRRQLERKLNDQRTCSKFVPTVEEELAIRKNSLDQELSYRGMNKKLMVPNDKKKRRKKFTF